jgi:hypothetical protein
LRNSRKRPNWRIVREGNFNQTGDSRISRFRRSRSSLSGKQKQLAETGTIEEGLCLDGSGPSNEAGETHRSAQRCKL